MPGEEIAPLVFPEWVIQVKEILANNISVANARNISRVAPPLLYVKREAYIPDVVSLGPYHHWKLGENVPASSSAGDSYQFRELKMPTMEVYKVQCAATFWSNCNKSIEEFVEKIKGMRQKIKDFYGWAIPTGGEYLENFALMMAIDSSFLLRFLSSPSESLEGDMRCFSSHEVSIKCDILKLENQIPLFVLREALNAAGEQIIHDFNRLWRNRYRAELYPFNQFGITSDNVDQPHILGCLHAFLSPLVQIQVIDDGEGATLFRRMKHSVEEGVEVVIAAVFTLFRVTHPSNEGRHDILKSYNAGELKKGGIQFKSFSTMTEHIRFDKYSGTLYLPQITVSEMQTEVLLRNMLALEFNDFTRGDHMTRYVGLMDCLIDTPDDVRLLRESQVLLRGSVMMSDESVADMWNGLCHPIFEGHLEPPQDLNNALREVLIRKYYMSIVKKVVWDFYWAPLRERLSNPGKGVALLVGILLLAMSFAQTFFAWWDWYNKNPRH